MSLFDGIFKFAFKLIGIDLEPEAQSAGRSGVDYTAPATDAGISVVYGEMRKIPGTIIFRTTNDTVRNDIDNELLHLIIVWGEDNGAQVKQIYIDDIPIESSKFVIDGHKFAYEISIAGQQYSDPTLDKSGWAPKYNHPEGLLYSYIRLEKPANEPLFSARPKITADIIQPNIYDVRLGRPSTLASNPALQLYDYLVNPRYGKGLSQHDLDINSFKRAATQCDMLVDSYTGGEKVPLYTSNIRLDTTKSVKTNCEKLLVAMRASLPVVNGRLTLVLDDDRVPVPWELNDDTIVSDIAIEDASKRERFNQVTVQYYDNTKNGKVQDAVFPDKGSDVESQWLAQDNGIRLNKKFKIDTLNNVHEAHRLAEFIARKSRDQLKIQLTARDDAALLVIGDVIKVTNDIVGFNKKPFMLTDMACASNGEVQLSLVEHQSSHYSWKAGVPTQPIPDTVHHSRNPEAPSGLETEVIADNKLRVSWQSALSDFEYAVLVDNKVVKAADSTQQFVDLELNAGDYQFSVRAVNALGYRSDVATLIFSLALPSTPIIKTVSLTHNSVSLAASVLNAAVNTNFEWQFGGEGSQTTVLSPFISVASLLADKTYHGRCRTLSVSGVSAWKSFVITTTKPSASEQVTVLAIELSQAPTWIGTGAGLIPANAVNQVRVALTESHSKEELAFQTLTVSINTEADIITAELEHAENHTQSPLEITFEGQGTSSLTLTAKHDLQVQRQTFSLTGVTSKDLEEIRAEFSVIDELAESVLEQALNNEHLFDADLTSTLHLEQKTDTTNAVVSEAAAAQASENEAIATRINTVKSAVEDSNARIVKVQQTLVSADQALSTEVSQLTSTVGENHSEIKTYFVTKVDSKSAISQAKTELESKVDDNRAYLDQTFYTKSDANTAIAAESTRLEASIGGHIGAVSDALNVVKSDVKGNNSALNTLTLRTQDIEGNITAVNSRVDVAQSDVDGNTSAISALNLRAENIEKGVDANASQISDVKTTADGAATATQNLTTRVSNSEGRISSANLTLQSHAGTLGQLSARAELGVDVNGTVTGMTITPGKMRIKAGTFELLDNSNNSAVYFDSSSGKYTFKGHIVANSGSFSGHVNATSGTFKGRVEASSGSFSGHVNATSGTFKGKVEASSGQFKGEIEATKGVINSVTLRSCKWDAGISGLIEAYSGQLLFKKSNVMNAIVNTNGVLFGRRMVIKNNRQPKSTGLDIEYHDNGIQVRAEKFGVYVKSNDWAFYAGSGRVGPHTSAHETLLPKNLTPVEGDILCDDELMHIADISNAICTAKLSIAPMDVSARGVFAVRRNLTDFQPAGLEGLEEWEQLAYLYDIASINAGGEGAMNVCGEGGNLQTGDLICSSSMLGKGMRQPTQSEERYTIAQVRHNVTFDSPDQVKMVAVIYKRG
ncbi:hypothetical protein [Pseudoalteromonas sp. MMG005]|uniref:hypothetical protein n=1 Tax=Pseudoalteromonas sp. MMG005 TaxID=2822682 RepID=UPI001B3A0D10|nr:hypothetical protein [Pseudoalteromonas sp. MMG005]MBQ4844930.1 hypothetical protein [Pseudoalteromonas sp. MMG005]